jgi:hypothetical protein
VTRRDMVWACAFEREFESQYRTRIVTHQDAKTKDWFDTVCPILHRQCVEAGDRAAAAYDEAMGAVR